MLPVIESPGKGMTEHKFANRHSQRSDSSDAPKTLTITMQPFLKLSFAAFAFTVLAFSPSAFAQQPPPEGKKLTVIIKPAKPFVFEQNGQPVGYAIDLWKRVASDAGITYEFKMVKTVPEVVEALKEKTADAGVGALSVTAEREAIIDFSHPIYDSGLQVLAAVEQESSLITAFSRAFSSDVLKVIGLLIGALVINGHILWFAERKKNPESFPLAYPHGMIEALWWSVCTLITGGCENKAPSGHTGRLLAIVWMLAGIGLVSYVTATLSASLTFNKLTSEIKGLGDLAKVTTGTVTGSSSASFLQARGLNIKGYETFEQACEALARNEVKAVVYDLPLLRYYLSNNAGVLLQLVGDPFERQSYGFAFTAGSPYLKLINRTLTKLREEGFIEEVDKKWFTPPQ